MYCVTQKDKNNYRYLDKRSDFHSMFHFPHNAWFESLSRKNLRHN